ncbi:D-alanyl-D-alanine carboxypeptidase family protein [Fulvimarina sp. 2208YS6-2-32]|uniref:serine-type D-Ala-D-Ala carboxypeptidase n=1 Tax=Fulvimarina uroteuthidis TaxID=3098149 RepID=A0ABU5I8C1_9HYPH|nr:D-alanyl-D-alanine carboxypeptidase family protein [Fulvimarina sp. 2208YS6-2-32]MDY8110496.1 D-alanyl-D-alanine carboxypeptidase family protein [Fulvimarina sp. 2208YS6-2-32]
MSLSSPFRLSLSLCCLLAFAAPTAVCAQEGARSGYGLETAAPRALLVEDQTGTVILDKNADQTFEPASLAKLMTMEVVFEALKAGDITLATEFPVSEHAWRTGGAPSGAATMFAAIGSSVPVADLIRGTIVQGANDGAIILAEGLAGSEDAFTERMNARASELGLENTQYANPTGLPVANGVQHTSARDLVTLTRHLRAEHPELYAIFSEPAFEWNKIFQRNRNPVLSADLGGEGVGTGFSEKSGYALMGAASKGGRTFLLALSGLATPAERASEAERLLNFGFDDLVSANVLEAGAIVGRVPVFNGVVETVPVRIDGPITILLPEDALADVTAEVRFEGPVIAPVANGDLIGVVDVQVSGETVYSQNVFANASAAVGSFPERARGALEELAFGWTRSF